MSKLKNIQKQFEEVLKQMKDQGLTAFKEAAREFFEKYPSVEAFRWNQYTPSWNDGSPCTFSVNEDSLAIKIPRPADLPEDDEWGDEDWFEYYGDCPEAIAKTLEQATSDAGDLLGPEELMETLFGTNVTVTVTRESISTEDYDCGY